MSRFELLLPKPIGMGVSVAECSVPASNDRQPRSASIVGRGGEGKTARHRHHVPPVGCGVSFFSVGVEGGWGLWCFKEEEESGGGCGVFLCVCFISLSVAMTPEESRDVLPWCSSHRGSPDLTGDKFLMMWA
jgi:hypothetical protein